VFEENTNPRVFDEIIEDRFRDMRLKVPLDLATVLRANTLEELERVPANHFLFTVVGPSEATAHHPAEMPSGLEKRNRQALARRGHSRHHSASGASVDHEIECLR
jgi:hypothetical protein